MPVYAYVCPNCGEFDAFLPYDAPARRVECPQCRRKARKACPQNVYIHAYTVTRDARRDAALGEFGSPSRKEVDKKIKSGEITILQE